MNDQLPDWLLWSFLGFTIFLAMVVIASVVIAVIMENLGIRLPERMRVPLGSDDPSLEVQEREFARIHKLH